MDLQHGPDMAPPWTKPIGAAPACKNRGSELTGPRTHTLTHTKVHKNIHTDGRSIAYSSEGGVHKYITGITEWVISGSSDGGGCVLCWTAGFSFLFFFYFECNRCESPFGLGCLMTASYCRLARVSDTPVIWRSSITALVAGCALCGDGGCVVGVACQISTTPFHFSTVMFLVMSK